MRHNHPDLTSDVMPHRRPPDGRRKVCPDAVLQAPEVGVPVLMVEVDRATVAPARVATKFAGYRELFRTRVRDSAPYAPRRTPRSVRCTGGAGPTPGTPARATRPSRWSSPAPGPSASTSGLG
ncbi:hypothetical protein P3T39_007222 [Kitasatospora sp. GP82]|nr:hypothetical protein [Kitasatospora sp. GP82]